MDIAKRVSIKILAIFSVVYVCGSQAILASNRYLDGSQFDTSARSGGQGIALILVALLVILFFIERGFRDLIRGYIYIIGGIFIILPLLFNPSMFSFWWVILVAIAFFSDRWEDKREQRQSSQHKKTEEVRYKNIDPSPSRNAFDSKTKNSKSSSLINKTKSAVVEGQSPQQKRTLEKPLKLASDKVSTVDSYKFVCPNCMELFVVSVRHEEQYTSCPNCYSSLDKNLIGIIQK